MAPLSAVMLVAVAGQLNSAAPPLRVEPSPGDAGLVLFPASDVEVEAEVKPIAGYKQLHLRIRVFELGASAPLFGMHYLVRPGETLFFRSPPEEEEELQFKVFGLFRISCGF